MRDMKDWKSGNNLEPEFCNSAELSDTVETYAAACHRCANKGLSNIVQFFILDVDTKQVCVLFGELDAGIIGIVHRDPQG